MSHGCPSTGAPSSRLRLTRKSIRTLGGRKWGRQPERCVFPLSYIVINPLPSHQSSPVLHCHIFSYHVLPCLFLSYLSLSCPPMSSLPSHVLPCPTLSSRVVSCPPLSSSFLLFPSLSFSFLLFPSHSSSLSSAVLRCPHLGGVPASVDGVLGAAVLLASPVAVVLGQRVLALQRTAADGRGAARVVHLPAVPWRRRHRQAAVSQRPHTPLPGHHSAETCSPLVPPLVQTNTMF